MPKKTSDYNSWRLKKLGDPRLAADYLNAAIADSKEMFLKALRNVAQAQQFAGVAQKAGLQRESLYRALSGEGNPTLDTLQAVLGAMGLKISIAAKKPPASARATRAASRRSTTINQ